MKKKRMASRGERIGAGFAKMAQGLDEEMTAIGERIHEDFAADDEWREHNRERMRERMRRHFERERGYGMQTHRHLWLFPFGFVGPLLGSAFGIFMLYLCAWVLARTNDAIMLSVSAFITSHLPWFFAAFLMFGYADYARRLYPRALWWLQPITSAAGATAALWVLMKIFDILWAHTSSGFFLSVSALIAANLAGFFTVVLVLGFIAEAFRFGRGYYDA